LIPENIKAKIAKQPDEVQRDTLSKARAQKAFCKLCIEHDSAFAKIYLQYDISAIRSDKTTELLDICFPDEDEILSATRFGHDIYDVPEGYLCLTTGEGEGFFLHEIKTGRIFDLNVDEMGVLSKADRQARWSDFYELFEWYLP
jgi:hypothetical protein